MFNISSHPDSGPQADPAGLVSRAQGTLPEAIRESDLPALNTGLRFLFADLRRAAVLFQEGRKGGRAGVAAALGALWHFIVLFEKPLSELLHVPILRLQDDLLSLDAGYLSEMLKPITRSGRAKSSSAREALRGCVAGTVKRLVQVGLSPQRARETVAKELRKLGIKSERGSGNVTDNTVRHWCETVAEDVSRRGPAAVVCDSMFTEGERQRFSELEPDKRRSFAVASLAGFVRANFPGIQARARGR